VSPWSAPLVASWTDDEYAVVTSSYFADVAPAQGALSPPKDAWWFRPEAVPVAFAELAPPPAVAGPPSVGSPPVVDEPLGAFGEPSCTLPAAPRFPFVRELWHDQKNFYSWRAQRLVLLSIGAGAALANSSWDRHFQDDVKFSQALHGAKFLGDGRIMLPTFAASMALGYWFDENTLPGVVGQWGGRSLRAAATGAPELLFLQYLLGGSRPNESPLGSHWHPFADNNGVSGHAFMGAIPFLTAAKMTDRPLLKGSLFVGSWLAGASRITDNNHYLSQVVMGWTIAAVAVGAVHETETGIPPRLFPWFAPGAVGFGVRW
jgi:hypothetical protein